MLDTIDEHSADWTAQSLALDGRVADHVVAFYEAQAVTDYTRTKTLRRSIFGAPAPEPPPVSSCRFTNVHLRAAA